jgi:hypothetical protein
MQNIHYTKDTDALLIELSKASITYTEDEWRVILHYSKNEKLVMG